MCLDFVEILNVFIVNQSWLTIFFRYDLLAEFNVDFEHNIFLSISL